MGMDDLKGVWCLFNWIMVFKVKCFVVKDVMLILCFYCVMLVWMLECVLMDKEFVGCWV